MNAPNFLTELDALAAAPLRALADAGASSIGGASSEADAKKMLQVALANEINVADLAASWVPSTPEVEVKIAFARQAGDEAGHFQLVGKRLEALGFQLDAFQAPGPNPLFEYMRGLGTSVERIAAGLYTLESIAYTANESFMAYSEKRGDLETVRIYREYIQPEERAHQALGRELLTRLVKTDEDRARVREVVTKVLAMASAGRAKAAEKLGAACFPGC